MAVSKPTGSGSL